jgi:hypothetical protein
MMDWLLRYLRRRLAAIEQAEAATASERIIRDVCVLGGVPEMAESFIAHGSTPASVARALAACIASRPC